MTKLIKWAVVHALDDRHSFLESIRNTNPEERAAVLADIAALKSCLDSNTAPTGDLLFRALLFAEQDRGALLDGFDAKSRKTDSYLVSEGRKLNRIRRYRMAHFGRSRLEAVLAKCTPVSVLDLLRSSQK